MKPRLCQAILKFVRDSRGRMGFRICYVGSACQPTDLVRHLRQDIAGTVAEMPDGVSWVAQIPESGWSILRSEDENFVARNGAAILETSRHTDVVACEVNETSMWSSAQLVRGGEVIWKVTHAGDRDDIYDLNETGALPSEFNDLKRRYFAAQQGDDGCDHIFEVPLDTANTLLMFRHDQYQSLENVDQFHVLKDKKRKGIFASLFDRR